MTPRDRVSVSRRPTSWPARLRRGAPLRLAPAMGGACLALLSACAPPAGDGAERSGDGTAVVARTGSSLIVILIDTLRADHTSVHGHRLGRTTTPALDALAAESFVFDRAYSAASWTRPSVASLLTGRLPSSHGCEDRDGVLAPDVTTLAETLHDGGWQTSGVVTNGQVLDIYGFDQGFDRFEHVKDSPRNAYLNAKRFLEPALQAVDRFEPADPFFLYLHLVDPHDPFKHHPETDFDPDYRGAMTGSREDLDPFRWEAPPPADKQRVIDLYDGEIAWMDGQLARLFEALDERGVLDDAWVLVTSDHGEGLWDHRIQSHGQEIYEHQVHVPLVLRPPGGLPARVDVTAPISSIDLAPTLVELLGRPVPQDFDGRSWAGALLRGEPVPDGPVVIDEKLNHLHMVAIIQGDQKLILELEKDGEDFVPIQRASVSSARLFDLTSNPREDPGAALDIRQRGSGESSRLHRELVRILAAAEERASLLGEVGPVVESEEQLEALRALGYLGDDQPPPRDH